MSPRAITSIALAMLIRSTFRKSSCMPKSILTVAFALLCLIFSGLGRRVQSPLNQKPSRRIAFHEVTIPACGFAPCCRGDASWRYNGYSYALAAYGLGRVVLAPSTSFANKLAVNESEDLRRKLRLWSVNELRAWVDSFVVRHQLCPWAARAAKTDDIKVVLTDVGDEDKLLDVLEREILLLLDKEVPRLSTTLVGCTGEWAQDFERFDRFVARNPFIHVVSLVSFHPAFSRFRNVDLKVGDEVMSHYTDQFVDPEVLAAAERQAEETGEDVDVDCCYRKSEEPLHGTVVRTGADCVRVDNEVGVRRVLVRFDDGGEEIVPVDYIAVRKPRMKGRKQRMKGKRQKMNRMKHIVRFDDGGDEAEDAELLADNLLHRSPIPVVHILRGDVLFNETDRAGNRRISDLQLRNACLLRRAKRIFKMPF